MTSKGQPRLVYDKKVGITQIEYMNKNETSSHMEMEIWSD